MKKPTLQASIIIIVSGRRTHLKNVLDGISNNTIIPTEVIIVFMNEKGSQNLKLETQKNAQNPFPFDLQLIDLILPSHRLPLAEARNTGARSAKTEMLLFLDVDCIPSPTYFDKMATCLSKFIDNDFMKTGLVMGTPRYLGYLSEEQKEIAKDIDFLMENSQFHPHRPTFESFENKESCQRMEHYELFWSLCFGISKTNFEKIGGFDTNFVGYGGEDTDFAFLAREKNIPFYLSDAIVFHQQHAVSSPPLGHFEDIVTNANAFQKKWKRWAMESWLTEFKKLGLIEWNEKSNEPIKIKNYPSKELLDNCLREKAAFA